MAPLLSGGLTSTHRLSYFKFKTAHNTTMQPKFSPKRAALILVVGASVILGGCGYKGPLVLPEQAAASSVNTDTAPTA
ncbi:LPS translocon maturation chaperone LptM [Paenalcaligenes sp. Me52]|uniref:LPS translocon maturation chaperone LptM n=1 Tax=Paenalcaligenes sp. Me52 TaxID=3392038 RepID=UPI001092AA60